MTLHIALCCCFSARFFILPIPCDLPVWRSEGEIARDQETKRRKKETSVRQIREVGCLATEIKIGRSLSDLHNSMPVMVRHDKLGMKGLGELLPLHCLDKRPLSWRTARKYGIKPLHSLDVEWLYFASRHIKTHLIYILYNFQAWAKESNKLVDWFSEASALNLSDPVSLGSMLNKANMLH